MKRLAAALTCTAFALAGCASPDGPTATPASIPTDQSPTMPQTPQNIPGELVGTWRSKSADGPKKLAPGSAVTVEISSDGFGLRPGCNSLTGDLVVKDKTLTAAKLLGTRMACDQPLMDQETWVTAMFGTTCTWELLDGGETLKIASGDQSITFGRFQRAFG